MCNFGFRVLHIEHQPRKLKDNNNIKYRSCAL
jgi:hypothetical protein